MRVTVGDRGGMVRSFPLPPLLLAWICHPPSDENLELEPASVLTAVSHNDDACTLRRYSKMRGSVTNSYIVNLAVSDFCFLVGLPVLIITAVRRQWIFGYVCCKLFYISTSLNWFTSVRDFKFIA